MDSLEDLRKAQLPSLGVFLGFIRKIRRLRMDEKFEGFEEKRLCGALGVRVMPSGFQANVSDYLAWLSKGTLWFSIKADDHTGSVP